MYPACWTSVSVIDEPAATTLLEREVHRTLVDRHHATRRDRRRSAGFEALTVQPAFCAPSTFLITLIVPVFVVLLNVQVHVSFGFTVTPTEPVTPF